MSHPTPTNPSPQPRFHRRMPCSLRIDGREHRALVVNLSRGGLFVRTTLRAMHGARLELDLPLISTPDAVPLHTSVVWHRTATSSVAQLNGGGLGLQLGKVPAAYEALMCELAIRPPIVELAATRFDVRLKQHSGPRSRWLQVDGDDEAAARADALSAAGVDLGGPGGPTRQLTARLREEVAVPSSAPDPGGER